jgi:hypothetical protein
MLSATASKPKRPRDRPPRGITADHARVLVDRSDETYHVVSEMLRQRCDQAIAARASMGGENITFAVSASIPGMPLYFNHRDKVEALLIKGLKRDNYAVERLSESMLYIEWGQEAEMTRAERKRVRLEKERAEKERLARREARRKRRQERKEKEKAKRGRSKVKKDPEVEEEEEARVKEEKPKPRRKSRSRSRSKGRKPKKDPLEVLKEASMDRRVDRLLKQLKVE